MLKQKTKTMVFQKLLIKVKKTISHSLDSKRSSSPTNLKTGVKKSIVGVLAFEIAGLVSKVTHLWRSLSDESIARLRSDCTCLEGVHKIVSNDDAFLLGLACAEFVEYLRLAAKSVSGLSKKCENPTLKCFNRLFNVFANTGCDPNDWIISSKDMESKIKKLDQFVKDTAILHREMDELVVLENGLKKSLKSNKIHGTTIKEQKIIDLQQKILWQRQEVKYLKENSLWGKSFDSVTLLLARSIFSVLARIKLVFGVGPSFSASLPRSLSASALVYPPENSNTCVSASGPLQNDSTNLCIGFFELNSEVLKPPSSTLGSAALALHYANLIIVMEKMIRSPQLIGADARDDLYAMLPNSIRFALRARLKGIGFSASDSVLANEWRDALHRILGWVSPLAHNMIKWHNERSLEHQKRVPKTNVLLLQTFYFANQEKTEAVIIELLVGLNYIWRFEREMNANALFHCGNINEMLNISQGYI